MKLPISFAHQLHTITRISWKRASGHSVSPVSRTAIKQCNYSRDNVIWHMQGKLTPQYNEHYTQLLPPVSHKNSRIQFKA